MKRATKPGMLKKAKVTWSLTASDMARFDYLIGFL